MAKDTLLEYAQERRQEIADEKKAFGTFAAFKNGLLTEDLALRKQINDQIKFGINLSEDSIDGANNLGEAQKKSGDAIAAYLPDLTAAGSAGGGMLEDVLGLIPGFGQVAIGAIALFKITSGIREAITDTRKELGVSYINAALITAENK